MKNILFNPLCYGAIALFFGFSCSCSTNKNTAGSPGTNGNTGGSGSATTQVEKQTIASNLVHPWGMAFLPDGRLLVTEREGRLRILDKNNKLSEPVSGVPAVYAQGQGGLQDVAVDPDFQNNSYIYLSYAEPGPNNTASTALGRGKLVNNQLTEFQVIFSMKPKVEGPNHFGSRVVFAQDGKLFLVLGERFKFDPAQDLATHMGKIIRINKDGSIPQDNPFMNQANAQKEIYSYGHRNIESAAIDPATGRLWVAEMGPKGGDELNMPEAGKNYGWPLVSWGTHYDGKDIPDPTTRPEFADATVKWTPVISPSGMTFYTGNMFPAFKGNMLIGGLTARGVVRVQLNGDQAKEVGRIDLGTRIRDVEQAPDGSIYVSTDQRDGAVWRLVPKQ
ncbi:PQQ-dependent sugar dehydrogenase [Pedobacter sp. SYSU D00535]|uniref:PQQ-dependent sugar dehydrogenase n=1 Tax=Pedobacter sp. SYSU D00535 TaxID=2810308 RepID=UPI001A96E258|nr:PQQ-dependent sugar dehydrogenase [Pedobacter sp. SYSU D00535]